MIGTSIRARWTPVHFPPVEGVGDETILAIVRLDAMTSSMRALSRALQVAWRRGLRLQVLLVRDLASSGADVKALRPASVDQLLAYVDLFRARIARVCPDVEIAVREGRLVDVVRRSLERGRPALAVVGERGEHGGRWARIVARTGIPMLVARRSRRGGVIVAASDATDAAFPTLTSVGRFFENHGPVELLHNIERPSSEDRNQRRQRVQRLFERRAKILRTAAMQQTPPPHLVLTSSAHPTSGIVDHCVRRNADLVVIGVHRRSRPLASLKRVAATLIETVARSVLIVPLAAAPAASFNRLAERLR